MLTLVQPSPIVAGQRVTVPHAVTLPSDRVLRAGTYTAVYVEGRRIVVRTRLDCQRLDKRFNPSEGPSGRITPLCCDPCSVYLEPGDYTAYVDGNGKRWRRCSG